MIKFLSGLFFCVLILFSFIRTVFPQALNPELNDLVRKTITNSVAATIVFTSTDSISAGSFVFHENDERGDTRFSVTRFPGRHYFNRWKDSWYRPFMTGSIGYFEDRETVPLDDPPDESRFKAVSISLGGGVKLETIKNYLWLIPEVDLIYGRTWNEHDYKSDVSNTFYKPLIDGILVNWKVDSLTYAPALQLAFESPVHSVTLGFDSRFTYLNLRTMHEDHPEHQVRSDSTLWKNRFRIGFPLGGSLFKLPLSLHGDFSRTDLGGDVVEPLKESFFYEVGTELAFDTSRTVHWLQSLSIGAGYTFSDRITGWSFRLGYKF